MERSSFLIFPLIRIGEEGSPSWAVSSNQK